MSTYTLESWKQKFIEIVHEEIPETLTQEIVITDSSIAIDGCTIITPPKDMTFESCILDDNTCLGVPECETFMAICVDSAILKLKGWYYWINLRKIA